MKRVAGYVKKCRRTSEMASQRKVIEEYCAGHEMIIMEWIGEDGESFGEVAFGDWLIGRKVDAVVVADSEYVSGSVYEFYAYKAVLKRRHSDLVAVNSGYAGYSLYTKLFDELVDTICRVEMENAPLKRPHDRIDKAARGTYIGGRAPMGYKVVNGKLEVNPDEVPVVLFILDRKRTGKSKLGTVDALNSAGYRNRSGKEFVISTVQSIWNNEMFYKGYYRYGKDGEWVKGQHEAIVK